MQFSFSFQNVFAVVDVHGSVEGVTICSSALVESITSLMSLAEDVVLADRERLPSQDIIKFLARLFRVSRGRVVYLQMSLKHLV